MFSMNSLNFIDSWLVPGDSLENHEFMENIGQANVFHDFVMETHGKHWPGQCFPGILGFPGFLADPRRFPGKPQIHGKHWPGQCFP